MLHRHRGQRQPEHVDGCRRHELGATAGSQIRDKRKIPRDDYDEMSARWRDLNQKIRRVFPPLTAGITRLCGSRDSLTSSPDSPLAPSLPTSTYDASRFLVALPVDDLHRCITAHCCAVVSSSA